MASDLPAFPTWQADPAWPCIDLLSDVHLHAEQPLTFAAWREHLLNTPAPAVMMLGDLFEAWVGDDVRHQGFEQQCLQVLRQASSRRFLAFMPGNRDFLVGDAMLADAGVQRLQDPTVLLAYGARWLLSHGDALCLADTAYQGFRRQVRSIAWQQAFLAHALPQRQQQARAMRDASSAHQAAMAPGEWSDVDPAEAIRWLHAAAAPVLIHGHTHRPGSNALGPGHRRHVLGDWAFDQPPHRAACLRLDAQGLTPLDLAA